MLTRNDTDKSTSWLEAKGPAAHVEETGFIDNWQTAMGQFIDEDLSISRGLHKGIPKFKRNSQLLNMIEEGWFPEGKFHHYSPMSEVAKYAQNELGMQEIRTDEDIDNDVRDELKMRREYAQGIYTRANTSGVIGRLGGTFHGAMLDPVTWPGMTVGVGAAARGASVLRAVGKAAVVNAGVAAAEEMVIQPAVYSFKKEIESPYTTRDAVNNILLAAGGAGTIGALTTTVGRMLRKGGKALPKETREALEYLKKEADSMPDKELDAGDVFDGIEKEATRINEAKPHGVAKEDTKLEDLGDDALDAEFDEAFPDPAAKVEAKVEPKAKAEPEAKAKPVEDSVKRKLDDELDGIDDELAELEGIELEGTVKEDFDELTARKEEILEELQELQFQAKEKGRVETDADVETKVDEDFHDAAMDISIPTRFESHVDGLRAVENKPLREVLDDLAVEEEKLLTLKACING